MLLQRQRPNCLATSEGVLLQSVSCIEAGDLAATGWGLGAEPPTWIPVVEANKFAHAAAHVVHNGNVMMILKQQLNEGCGVGC